ncbi:hypothetical protein JCM21714_3357 [Gracilibacillus boraciitolerans JCM 21714]|uniref:Uncharacterized protein n=1 Tax=Gracilibacillus boraciitolerans JCM 21714 TaxID=1298598 RepID=W4VN92_9BACI|nr:hypothetical protein [Gracilibacillus boraciitolerans]GAE94219.1 hypothetical protein JCM21714_3357 [Gracilibacillus boraciitolerans JCM 21714]
MKISRLVLWSIILLLLITNLTTILLLSGKNNEDAYILSNNNKIDRNKPLAEIEKEEIMYQDWMAKLINKHGEQVLNEMIDKEVIFQLANGKISK